MTTFAGPSGFSARFAGTVLVAFVFGSLPACRPSEVRADASAIAPVPVLPVLPGAGGPISAGALPSPSASAVTPLVPLPAAGARIEDEKNTISVFRAVAGSTVFVTQTRVVVDYLGGTAQEVEAGSGSGFVWDTAGHIVTNFHVVQGAQALTVTLRDERTLEAHIVGVEPRKDIAVLKLEAPESALSAIRVANPKEPLEVGQKTIAIGNPFGLDHTLTTGVISAVGRQVQGIGGVTIRDMIQTDAAINPGNSGGPLLDSAGQLIGMNTMIYSRSGSSAGIGFAVPVATIARVVPQIIRTGKAEEVGLAGVNIDPVQRYERRFGIRGVIVHGVAKASPAARAGMRGVAQTRRGLVLGDVIVGIGDKPVTNYDDLYNALDARRAGDKVDVKLMRDDVIVSVVVELGFIE